MLQLTPQLVARFPRPGTSVPGKIAFTPDGRHLTYLHSELGDLARELWQCDLETGARSILFRPPGAGVTDENVSREEALRRERERLRETGVTHYAWAEEANVFIVPIRGDVYLGDGRRIATGAIDPQITRDGKTLGFVRDGALYAVDFATGRERLLAKGEGVTCGLAEFMAQEEMHRPSGFWFSRDGRQVAFAEVDERHLPVYPIVHQGKDKIEIEEHRYPFAGEANAKVRLGVVSVEGGPVKWLDLGGDEYLARVAWHPDGRLFYQTQTRDQRRLALRDSTGKTLLVEETPIWTNLHNDLRFLKTGEFVWASERTGFKHLYLCAADGTVLRPLTSGQWPVDAVIGHTEQDIVFAAGMESPLERHLFRVSFAGGPPVKLTKEPGWHDGVLSKDGSRWVDYHESRTRAPSIKVGSVEIHSAEPVDLPGPELMNFKSSDGETLFMSLYKPAKLPAPCIVSVYGGPHVQYVADTWLQTVDLRAQYLAQLGFLVAKIDNRGSARRGLAFEGAIAGRMGTVEVEDQVDGVRHLASKGLIDPRRVGIYGWSYGGYMAAMCLAKAPEVFKVAVSGAPVTSWDGYDTHYTERYMRTPRENPEGYREGSVMTHVEKIRGKLLLVHGMLDENVHFRHTARLIDALAKANKSYDLLLYPNERHMPRSEKDRADMEARIAQYFGAHL